jgi:protein O-mannosyl-transferase
MLLFAMGLMCKPMLVTLPVVLLLLDYWPLQRVESAGKLVLEKLPLLALSAADCVPTLLAQHGAMQSGVSFSLSNRLGNALASFLVYLGQMVWPRDLVFFYPFPHNGVPAWEVALAGALLAGFSTVAVWQRWKQPWLLVGWLWYLVMLLPVVGILQVGGQSHADRYTYLPQIGIYVAVTWLVAQWQVNRVILGSLMTAVLVVLMVCASQQTAFWQNNQTVWNHTLACTTDNDIAHYNLGIDFRQKGRVDEEIAQYQAALQINPDFTIAHLNLGLALVRTGRADEAITQFQEVLRINPDNAAAHVNLGNIYRQKGRQDEAIAHFQRALQIEPANSAIQNNLAWLLATCPQASLRNGHKALELARQANELSGGENPIILRTLAAAFAEAGRFPEAVETAQRALQLARAQSNTRLAGQLQYELKLYQSGTPFHNPAQIH